MDWKDSGRPFYRVVEREDGLVDVWLTPGEAVPMKDSHPEEMDYHIRLLAVRGIQRDDPQWNGNLEDHIRRHYLAWLASAEKIEI